MANIQDRMCYEITKFQRTTTGNSESFIINGNGNTANTLSSESQSQTTTTQSIESNNCNNTPEIVPTTITTEPKSLKTPYNNGLISCNCSSAAASVQSASSSTPSVNIIQYYYCPDCERETKKSRTLKFGSGGDVFVDKKHHTYYNTTGLAGAFSNNWVKHEYSNIISNLNKKDKDLIADEEASSKIDVVEESPSIPPRSDKNNNNRTAILSAASSSNEEGDEDGNKCFTVSIKLPNTFDFNLLAKPSHHLSINISIHDNNNVKTNNSNNKQILSSTVSAPSGTLHSNVGLDIIKRNLQHSGFYYGRMDWQDSIRVLKSTPIGTFLLRDSGDPNYAFSLSIQTEQGPISSRISYRHNKFRLDSQERILDMMPTFDDVISLIEYYIKHGLVKNSTGRQVWVDSNGSTFSPVHLKQPKRKFVPSLQHLSRLTINKQNSTTKLNDSMEIPPGIKSFLKEYPHTI